MNNQDKNISVNDAKSLLDSIDQQKRKTAEVARLPLWLNVTFSILFTWLVSYDYFGVRYETDGAHVFVPFILLFGGLFFWYRWLKKRGMKPKVFALTKVSFFAFLGGMLSAMFFSDILSFLHDNYSPIPAYALMICFACLFGYLSDKYPLSEPVSEGE